MPPPPPPPPAGGNVNHAPTFLTIIWVETLVVLIIVGLRMYARVMIRGVGRDDWAMVFTTVIFLIMIGFNTYLTSIGGLRHLYYLTPDQQMQAVKYNWITQPWCIFGFATGKISVALLLLRIMGTRTKWRKIILYFIMISVFITNSIACIISFAQCNPPKALWNPQLAAIPGTCWEPHVQSDYAIFMSSYNVFLDAVLAVFPVTIFWNLKMSLKKRISLCVLMGLGLIASISGAIKVKYLSELTARSDITWDTYNLFIWSITELMIIIVCGSIPPIKPLYDRFLGSKKVLRRKYIETSSYNNSESIPMKNHDHKDSTYASATLVSVTAPDQV